MITLRLDPELENDIQNAAKLMGLSKSELVRRSVSEYINNLKKPSPWELGENLFGKHSSGKSDLSHNRKGLFKQKVRAKRQ